MTHMAHARPFLAASLLGVAAAAPAFAQSATQLWQNNCMRCHGENGEGANARSLLDDEWLLGPADRDLFKATKEGIEESGMPAYGETLSDEQVWALVVHVRELRAQDRRRRLGSPRPDAGGVYASQHARFRLEPVIERGLDVPWSVDFLPDAAPDGHISGGMLVTSRSGAVKLWKGGTLSDPIKGTPEVRNRGQGGMMDVAVHPQYQQNGWIYLSYSDPSNGGRDGLTRIVRGKVRETRSGLAWTDQETIFEARREHYSGGDIHFGSRIVFEPKADGGHYVWFCIGERGRMEWAQELGRPNGKVYRLNDDGSVPRDNPFVGRRDAYEQVWSYGHRNPQGLAFDLDGRLWVTEHGPRGGDELNLIEKGRNYGWPLVSFGINYSDAPFRTPWPPEGSDIAMPTYVWLPSIAACGLDVMRGDMFPTWRGDLMAGGLAGQNVDRLRVKDGEVVEREEIIHGLGRVRDVVCGPDGSLYVVLNQPDIVVRLVAAD